MPQPDSAAYVEAVLALVERIPPGRVMAYGAIAEFLYDEFGRGSARRVGTIMAQYGGSVPWFRVVSGAGRLPPGHEQAARDRLAAEGVQFRASGRIAMADYAWWPEP
jgi:alkylated DNA nucleotide flippase Atl1